MASFLYSIALRGYGLGLHIAALFNPKARKWVNGRKNWRQHLRETVAQWPETGPRLWMHCASLGEFEQGRPVLEAARQQWPELKILLTFFSPSGYELRKHYPTADHVAYLPLDGEKPARDFLDLVRPDQAIFVKYDFWFHFLRALRKREISTLLIAALFRKDQYFFRWYRKWFKEGLRAFTFFFAQNRESQSLLESSGFSNVRTVGDPRVDRVLQIQQEAKAFPEIQTFCAAGSVLIVGSSWPPDEVLLTELYQHPSFSGWRMVIAPHDISEGHLKQIEMRFGQKEVVRYSQLPQIQKQETVRILLIDNIGMLSSIYRYGELAYVGGAFGKGLHNTLEPVAAGLPVLFGPKFEQFEEAVQFVKEGIGFSFKTARELISQFETWKVDHKRAQVVQKAKDYIQRQQGATEQIMEYLNRVGNKWRE